MEKICLEAFPTSRSAQRMLSYVSDGFYDNSYIGKWLFQVMGLEYDTALAAAESLPEQFFLETATWGLKYHEIKWQLPVREELSYEERRQIIRRKRDFKAPVTPANMEAYLDGVFEFRIHVADIHDPGPYLYIPNHPNVFRVYFVGGNTLNVKEARRIISWLKQSHTTYEISDRMELEVDNSGLGRFQLPAVRFRARMPYWRCRVYDGSSRYDGSWKYDARRQYEPKLKVITRVKAHTEIGVGRYRVYDGSLRYDGSVKYDAVKFCGLNVISHIGIPMEPPPGLIGEVTLETQKRISWSGAISYDGTETYDSSVKEEENGNG